MKLKIDDFLTADLLGTASKQNPVTAKIKQVNLIVAADVPFKSEKDRYELTIELDGEDIKWMPNKTSLKNFRTVFGSDTDNWTGRQIKIWWSDQNVNGQPKKPVFGEGVITS